MTPRPASGRLRRLCNYRLEHALADRIEAAAAGLGVSRTRLAERALEEYLARLEADPIFGAALREFLALRARQRVSESARRPRGAPIAPGPAR